MEIRESYYLRRTINNKVALVGLLATSDTECQEKVLLIADEYVKDSHEKFNYGSNDNFFVMRVGEEFVVCCQIENCFYMSSPCKNYRHVGHEILLLKDDWWRWVPQKSESMECLGKIVWNKVDLFINEPASPDEFITLSFYDLYNNIEIMKCKKCQILTPQLAPAAHKTACNAMKIVDDKGKTHWVSIQRFNREYEIIITPKRYEVQEPF